MRLRSLLFVPGDRPDRFGKAFASGADAVILDLEDSVSAARKHIARRAVADAIALPRGPVAMMVRINPLGSGSSEADLDAVVAARADAIMLPKAEGAASITQLAQLLAARGSDDTLVLPIATETPAALFRMGDYAGVAERLIGLTWGAEDLPAAIGAATGRDEDGRFTAPIELARSLTLFGASAAGIAAIETVYPHHADLDGLGRYAARGARDGFTGMMAIHPAQVHVINQAFSPSPDSIATARAVVAAFAENPGAGVLSIDGKMVDAPHLKLAQRILARASV